MRHCLACGAPLIQRDRERGTDFRRRQNCNRDCGNRRATVTRQGMNARLDAEKVRSIRASLAAGEPVPSIAAAYDISPSAISHIKNGKNWRHID